jgi:hypothetical protein
MIVIESASDPKFHAETQASANGSEKMMLFNALES